VTYLALLCTFQVSGDSLPAAKVVFRYLKIMILYLFNRGELHLEFPRQLQNECVVFQDANGTSAGCVTVNVTTCDNS
jgi:hypothetical protein